MKKPTLFVLIGAMVIAAIAGAWVARATLTRPQALTLQYGTALTPPPLLPEMTLIGEDKRPFTRAEFEGHWSLVFFGFTHCPDVCPSTLTLLADVHRRVQDLPLASRPNVVFVSVDPERDTPEVMADYVHAFNPAFRGVTGSVQDIDALAAAVGIAHRKVPMGDQYMVDHTAAVMLVDPRGRRVAVFSPPLDAAGIASDVRRAVATEPASG